MSEHIWVLENLASHSAAGLCPEEAERVERHLPACPECRQTLDRLRTMNDALEGLFAPIRPGAALEDRVIHSLRTARPRRLSKWTWVLTSVAAGFLLAAVGAGFQAALEQGNLMFPGEERVAEFNDPRIRTASAALEMDAGNVTNPDVSRSFTDGSSNTLIFRSQTKGKIHHGPNYSDGESILKGQAHGLISGLKPSGTLTPSVKLEDEPDKFRGYGLASQLYRDVDAKGAMKDFPYSGLMSLSESADFRRRSSGTININSTQTKTESDALIRQQKTVQSQSDLGKTSERELKREQDEVVKKLVENKSHFKERTQRAIAGGEKDTSEVERLKEELKELLTTVQKREKVIDALEDDNKKLKTMAISSATEGTEMASRLHTLQEKALHLAKIAAQNQEAVQPKKDDPTKSEPSPDRKVIRTGDIEFEIDSFDAAATQITTLVKAVKGAFILTRNSDKLENGKTKGAVVVRMPPEHLDDFLLALRRDLGKIGELKNQRVGSQDVSKQFTDTESALRAARTMEARLLDIIKTGKGEIKDLLVAEKQLGVTRTQIEQMEGEIRYLGNQVALSTLTVNLVEREFRAPAALVVSERVRVGIEVEEVEKAQSAIHAAVAELKGRVVKSELKQHAGGQLEVLMDLEVAAEHAGALRQKLAGLGIVTDQDTQRVTRAEGGTGRGQDLKPRVKDVQFQVTLYNLANVEPRETVTLQIASGDVPGGFHKLEDAVAQARGLMRQADLKEEDRLNVTAQLHFDVLTSQKTAIDRVLAEIGDVITRGSTQAKIGDKVTPRKVGYRLDLISVARIAPREQIAVEMDVRNVEQAYATVVDMVKGNNGLIAVAQLNHEKNGQITGQLRFDVPLALREAIFGKIKELGTVRVQQSTRNQKVPDSPLATAQVLLTLTNAGPIVPQGEGLWQQIRTSLFYSFKLVSWSLVLIILGLSVALPWGLVVWLGYKVYRRARAKSVTGVRS